MSTCTYIGMAVLCIPAVLCCASHSRADTRVRQKKHVAAYAAGERQVPARESISTTWIGDGMIRTDDGAGKAIIVRHDRKRVYHLDHEARTFREIPMQSAPVLDSPRLRRAKAEVIDTGEERNIGPWKCRKYLLTLQAPMGNAAPDGRTESEVWASEEVPVNMEAYNSLANLFMSMQPYTGGTTEEIEKIRGFPVRRTDRFTLTGDVRESSLELLEVSEGMPPVGTYDVPEGYVKSGP